MLVYVCLYQYINLQARAVTSIDSSSKTKIFILLLQKVIFFQLVKKSNSTEFYVLYHFFLPITKVIEKFFYSSYLRPTYNVKKHLLIKC